MTKATRLRVLQVNKLYYPHIGGIEKLVYLLSEELAKRPGIEVKVLVCNTEFRTRIERASNLEVIRVASLGTLFSMPVAPAFPLWLRKLDADIYHYQHPFPPGELCYLLARPGGKLLVTWQSDIVRQRTLLRLYEPFLQMFLRKANLILATSPNYLESSRYLRPFREKCRVVPNGIDPSHFRATPEIEAQVAAIRARHGPSIVLFVGRLVYYKGLPYLLKAMTRIRAKLLIIGEGPLEKELRELVKRLHLSEKVVFLGPVSEETLVAHYHACDVFVLPSIANSEAFGLVQLEAMACGKPVVSTDLPTGVPYVNQHGKTGLIVPPRDPEALARAINTLLEDPGLREQFGQYAKRRVEREFTIEIVAEKVLEIYRELVERHQGLEVNTLQSTVQEGERPS